MEGLVKCSQKLILNFHDSEIILTVKKKQVSYSLIFTIDF